MSVISALPETRGFGREYPELSDEEQDPYRETPGEAVKRQLPILDWRTLFADEEAEEWIIEPLLPARRLVAMYSAPKCGKSLLALELAVGIARGTRVLGVMPNRPRRVLYVDYENDPRGDIRTRLEAMGYGPDDLANLCYLSFPTLGGLDTLAGSCELVAAIEVYECEVVVIDTVSRSVVGEENANDTWLNFYRQTGLKLKQAGVAMLRLDHSGKDEAKGQRGGSAKVGDVDAVWKLERSGTAEDTFKLTCEANRMPVAEKLIVLTRITQPVLRHEVVGGGWRAEVEATILAVIAAADAAGLPLDAGRPRVAAAAKAAGVRASKDRLGDAVKRRKAAPEPPGQLPLDGHAPDPSGQMGAAGPPTRISAGQSGIDTAPDMPGQPGAAPQEGAAPAPSSLREGAVSGPGQMSGGSDLHDWPDPTDDDEPLGDEWR